jgi:hypothetical protein
MNSPLQLRKVHLRGLGEGVSATPVELVRLFGGHLLSCEPIRGHFYRCWFT